MMKKFDAGNMWYFRGMLRKSRREKRTNAELLASAGVTLV